MPAIVVAPMLVSPSLSWPTALRGRRSSVAHAPRHLAGHGGALEQRLAEQLGVAGQRLGRPRCGRRGGRGGFAGGVEQDGGDVHAGDAVDERVVGLGDHREASAGHALHQPHLPQGLRAVEPLGEDAPGQALQRALVAGARQRGVAYVVVGVEVGVVGPDRTSLSERHVREPLAVARHEVQAADDVLDEFVERRRVALEHHHGRDVHVRSRVVLEVQERRVERRQAIGVCHRSDSGWSAATRQRPRQKYFVRRRAWSGGRLRREALAPTAGTARRVERTRTPSISYTAWREMPASRAMCAIGTPASCASSTRRRSSARPRGARPRRACVACRRSAAAGSLRHY